MRVTLVPNDTAAFLHERVTKAPTVVDVLSTCQRHPFTKGTLQHARRHLACMLEGRPYSIGGTSHVVLEQFRAGDDPYAYYRYVASLEKPYPCMQTRGSWVKSVARLLICWVAEELKSVGVGGGFADHFRVSEGEEWREADTPLEREGEADTPSERVGEGLEEYYDEREDSPSELMPGTPCSSSSAGKEGTVGTLTPPEYSVQMARTCSLIPPLRDFLSKGGKQKTMDYLHFAGPVVFDTIKQWIKGTEEGRRHARMHANIDPDSFHLDHVISREMGGPSHVCNAYLMPGGHNSHFHENWTKQKRDYVGRHAVRAATQCLKWGVGCVNWKTFESS